MTNQITAPLELKEVATDGTFSGYASVYGNVDLDGDVMEAGAFDASVGKKGAGKIKLLWQHDPSQPIGVWTDMASDKRGLKVTGRLLVEQGVPKADEAYALLKAGALDAMSVGFAIPEGGWEWDEKKRVRRIKSADLWEVSLVTFPANPKAIVQRVKSVVPFQDLPMADRSREWSGDTAEGRVRQWAGGGSNLEDMDWERYRRAFVWYSSDEPANVAYYKLQIADIINGELTVIPRAVFAAAGAVLGARGGVELSDNDRSRVVSHLERYYSKLDMESPFKAIDMGEGVKSYVAAFLAAAQTPREIEAALRDVGLSNREAKAAASVIAPQRDVEGGKVAQALKTALAELSQLTTH